MENKKWKDFITASRFFEFLPQAHIHSNYTRRERCDSSGNHSETHATTISANIPVYSETSRRGGIPFLNKAYEYIHHFFCEAWNYCQLYDTFMLRPDKTTDISAVLRAIFLINLLFNICFCFGWLVSYVLTFNKVTLKFKPEF